MPAHPISSDPRSPSRVLVPSPATTRAGILIVSGAMAFMAFDILEELADTLGWNIPSYLDNPMFEVLEIASVLGLGLVVARLSWYLRALRYAHSEHTETISLLRGQFGEVLEAKFTAWRLTRAERDVTMLILKGLSVADIAAARNTAPGTIKAQSTSIFRKVGVGSKSELLSLIIDEFLDDTAQSHTAATSAP